MLASATVSSLDADVASAIAHAAVTAVCAFDGVIAEAAVTCVGIILNRYNGSCLPLQSAIQFIRTRKLPALSTLENHATSVYASIVRCLLSEQTPDAEHLRVIKEALDTGAAMLCEEFITEVTVALLDNNSRPIASDTSTSQNGDETVRSTALVEILTPLARGRFSTAVDLGLRKHFDGRPKKRNTLRYAFVDESLSTALHGTSFEVIKSKSDETGGAADGMMILSALDHPERSVRLNALDRLIQSDSLPLDGEQTAIRGLQSKVFSMIATEDNMKVVASAFDCALKFLSSFDSQKLLKVVGTRFIVEFSVTTSPKPKALAKLQKQLKKQLLTLCRATVNDNQGPVRSLLFGCILDSAVLFGISGEKEKDLRSLLVESLSCDTDEDFIDIATLRDGTDLHDDVVKATQLLFSSTSFPFKELLEDLKDWKPSWASEVMSMWIESISSSTKVGTSEKSIDTCLSLMEILRNDIDTTDYAKLIGLACTTFCNKHVRAKSDVDRASPLWTLAASTKSDIVARKAIKALVRKIGFNDTVQILKTSVRTKGSPSRAFSLRWFLNISTADSLDVIHESTVIMLLIAWYGEDELLRSEAQKFCSQVKERKNASESSRNNLLVLCRMLLQLPTIHAKKEIKDDNLDGVLDTGLRDYVTLNAVRLFNLPNPLTSSKFTDRSVPSVIANVLKDMKTESNIENKLNLFRAVDGHVLSGKRVARDYFKVSCETLKQAVTAVQSNEDIEHHIELLARLVMCLHSYKKPFILEEEASSAFESVVSLIQLSRAQDDADLHQAERLNITLYATGILILTQSKPTSVDKDGVFLHFLLSSSTKASGTGVFSQKVLDAVLGHLIPLSTLATSVDDLSDYVGRKSKKPRLGKNQNKSFTADDAMSEKSIGAIETVRRLSLRQGSTPSSTDSLRKPLRASLWMFLKTVAAEMASSKFVMEEDTEYILHLCLDSLCGLHSGMLKDTETDDFVNMKILVSFLSSHGDKTRSEATASSNAIRKATLKLVQVLAPNYGSDLQAIAIPVIESLLNSMTLEHAADSLEVLVPSLLKGGSAFSEISNWLCKTAFKEERRRIHRVRLMSLVASCCRHAPDVEQAVLSCLDDMISESSQYLSIEELGKDCATFLNSAGLSVKSELIVISKTSKEIRCFFATSVLMQSRFVNKLFETMNSSGAQDASSILSHYSGMLVNLAQCGDDDSRDLSMGTALAILPLPALAMCIKQATASKDINVQVHLLASLTHRLDDLETALTCSWELKDDDENDSNEYDEKVKGNFLRASASCLGDVLKSVIEKDSSGLILENSAQRKLKQMSILAIEKVVERFGSFDAERAIELSEIVLDVMDGCTDAIQSSRKVKDQYGTLSVALRCTSSIISGLGPKAVAIIPRGLDVSVTLIDWAFGNDKEDGEDKSVSTMVSLTTGAIMLCTCVLDSAPMFFGQHTLQRLTALLLGNKQRVLEEVVDMAIQKMPSSSAIGAIWDAVEQLEVQSASSAGIDVLLKCLHSAIPTMKRTELRVELKRLTELCLKCLEYGRFGDGVDSASEKVDAKKDKNGKGGDGLSEEARSVWGRFATTDDICGDMLTTLTLRLSESDFKKMLGSLVHWYEGGCLPDSVSSASTTWKITLEKNLLRAVPFFRILVKLFKKLNVIMVPHYLQLLDKVLGIISLKDCSAALQVPVQISEKKRKRSRMEEDGTRWICLQYVMLQRELQDVCVSSVTCLLKQPAGFGSLNETVIAKIQEALLSCFDECGGDSETVTTALTALGARLAAPGSAEESREESRQLLVSLSRQLLLRTREEDEKLREGALLASKTIALTVGDEYLVTLPETMPVLAEVIDDEKIAVQKAAKAFAVAMEALAGEPLLDQLK